MLALVLIGGGAAEGITANSLSPALDVSLPCVVSISGLPASATATIATSATIL